MHYKDEHKWKLKDTNDSLHTYTLLMPFVDVKKMPLGKLSKTQIAKGFEALEEIQAAVEGSYREL